MAAPGSGNQCWLWDDQVRGFGVLMLPSGRKSYIVQYRVSGGTGRAKRMRIGTHGSPWTPDAARERALALLRQVADGVDPARSGEDEAARVRDVEEAREHFAFGAFADRFIANHVVAGALRSRADIEGTFERDLRPWFGDRSVLEITKQDVKDMLASVSLRSRSAANKAHKWLNRMFTWGMKHDRLETSPMFGLTKPHPERKRDRVLTDRELKLLAGSVDGVIWQFAALILMLILTGQRLREVAGMRWEEIDLRKREWIIPAERTKNKRRHLVPLSRQMVCLLRELRKRTSGEGLLLTTTGSTPISGFSDMKETIDAAMSKASPRLIAHWVVHDLRRTFATGCAQMRIPIEHSEAALNHVSGTRGGVAGVYHLYQYAAEKRIALQRWADRIERVVGKGRLLLD